MTELTEELMHQIAEVLREPNVPPEFRDYVLTSFTVSQRCMIGAVTATATDSRKKGANIGKMQAPEAAKLLNVNRSGISAARLVRRKASAEEIAQVMAGAISANTLMRQIAAGKDAKARAALRAMPLSQRAGNVLRAREYTERTALWRHLRTAIIALNQMPKAADVVPIARIFDKRSALLDKNLDQALNWLKEFHHGFRSNEGFLPTRQARRAAAREKRAARTPHDHPGDGDQAPRTEQT